MPSSGLTYFGVETLCGQKNSRTAGTPLQREEGLLLTERITRGVASYRFTNVYHAARVQTKAGTEEP